MKWISLTYLITPLLIGCTPNDNNSDLFTHISLKNPLEQKHITSVTREHLHTENLLILLSDIK